MTNRIQQQNDPGLTAFLLLKRQVETLKIELEFERKEKEFYRDAYEKGRGIVRAATGLIAELLKHLEGEKTK